jgi:hypothetical protein
MKSIMKYAIIFAAILLVGALSVGVIGTVYAQIAQPIAQTGGGVSIAQPVSQGGYIGPGVVSAPFVASGIPPGYTCYQRFPGGPITCYPGSRVFSTGGTFITPGGGVIQPVQQTGFGTQVAAPVAVI